MVDLEATTFATPGKESYWFQRGWAQQAPIKTMTRIDSPQSFGRAAAGDVTVAGIAWAQHTGIAAVEPQRPGPGDGQERARADRDPRGPDPRRRVGLAERDLQRRVTLSIRDPLW